MDITGSRHVNMYNTCYRERQYIFLSTVWQYVPGMAFYVQYNITLILIYYNDYYILCV